MSAFGRHKYLVIGLQKNKENALLDHQDIRYVVMIVCRLVKVSINHNQ